MAMSERANPNKRELAHKRGAAAVGREKDEEVIVVVRQFIIALRRPILFGGTMLVLVMLPWALASNYATNLVEETAGMMWLGFGLAFCYGFWHWVSWYYSVYVLTNKSLKIITQKGFFNRKVSDMELHNIQSVNYHVDGFNASLFGYGNVLVQTLSGSGDMELKFVHKPAVLAKQIIDAVHKYTSNSSTPPAAS